MDIEEPVACRYASAFHFHAASTGMLGPTLIGDQVVEVREPGEKRLLTAVWMVKRFRKCIIGVDHVFNRQELRWLISQRIHTCDTPSRIPRWTGAS